MRATVSWAAFWNIAIISYLSIVGAESVADQPNFFDRIIGYRMDIHNERMPIHFLSLL
jgi:hypothetical protein